MSMTGLDEASALGRYPWLGYTFEDLEKLVKECLEKGTARLELGRADQGEVSRRRKLLHAAVLRLTVDPIEILTLQGRNPGDVALVLRRFRA